MDAHDLWFEANARSNNQKQLERERLERAQEADEGEGADADLTDINNLFAEKHQGPHVGDGVRTCPIFTPTRNGENRMDALWPTCWQSRSMTVVMVALSVPAVRLMLSLHLAYTSV